MRDRLAVYTAAFGEYDSVVEIPPGDYDVVVFTDDERVQLRQNEVRLVKNPHINPRLLSRFVKALPNVWLPDYRWTLWLDASFTVSDPAGLMREFDSKRHCMVPVHRHRKCIYEEAQVCTAGSLDDPARIKAQIDRYRKFEYPANHGLHETGILFRDALYANGFNCEWWREICGGSWRDQLSFNYAAWIQGLEITNLKTFPELPWLHRRPHLKPRAAK